MKNYYFCKDDEWDRIVNGTDERQNPRHFVKIEFALRVKFETELKNVLFAFSDVNTKEYIDIALIHFDPEMEYYPKSYWQVSLVFYTWSRGMITIINDFLNQF